MTALTSEQLVLERLIPNLEAEGYEVFVNPRRAVLPAFFEGYRPDVIALRTDRNLAIELKHGGEAETSQAQQLAKRFKDHKDWELRIIWVAPLSDIKNPKKQSYETISEKLAEVDRLISAQHFEGAFLLGWAVLEAVGRTVVANEFARPQTPGRLVEVLAADGLLTPDEADSARLLIGKRNKLAHGELNVVVSRNDAQQLSTLIRAVLSAGRH